MTYRVHPGECSALVGFQKPLQIRFFFLFFFFSFGNFDATIGVQRSGPVELTTRAVFVGRALIRVIPNWRAVA